MSENQNNPPSRQTSSVPLKKETVRVSLKASDLAPAVPSATLPPTPAPTRPPTPSIAGGAPIAPSVSPVATMPAPSGAPTAPRPPTPAPTIPLRTAAPLTAGTPTIKLATSAGPVGAPTIALKTANAPLSGGSPTMALPKATVALSSPTSASLTQKPTLSIMEENEDESGADTFSKILAGVGLVAALIVLGLQLKVANVWIGDESSSRSGEWSQILE